MKNEDAINFILQRLPCPVRQIELPSDVKAKALRTLRNRQQIIKCRDEYACEYFYLVNPEYKDQSLKTKVLETVIVRGTIRISMLKEKLGCSKSSAYEAVRGLIAENKVRIVTKETGNFLISI